MTTIRERKPGVWEVRASPGRDANSKTNAGFANGSRHEEGCAPRRGRADGRPCRSCRWSFGCRRVGSAGHAQFGDVGSGVAS